MNLFHDNSVDQFLDAVAARTPTPGGGTVIALAGAISCVLARMVAAYSTGKHAATDSTATADLVDRLRRCDELMRRLAHEDAAAYENLVQASRLRREGAADAVASHNQAVLAATTVPLEIGAVASAVLADMNQLASIANRNLFADLAAAAVLACAAARAAKFMVQVNARSLADSERREKALDDIRDICERCARDAASIESIVEAHLQR